MPIHRLIKGLIAACFIASSSASSAEILIGQSIALTGGLAQFGQAVVRGAKLHIDQVNATGGLGGQRIQLISIDDAGKADRTAENVKQLIETNKVVAIFGGIEGGPCTRSLKVASQLKTPFIACLAGSPEMREPFDNYAFTVRAPHFAEFEKIVEIAASRGYTRFGFLHSDSDTGKKHLANVNKLLALRGLSPALSLAMSSGVKPQTIAEQLLSGDTQVVLNHGGFDFYADVILQVRAKSANRPAFFAVNSGIAQMSQKLGTSGRGVVFTSVVPFPNSGREEIVREFRRFYETTYGKAAAPSLGEIEGYISARVLVEGLKRAGSRPTRESLTTAMNSFGSLNLGGYVVQYGPNDRQGSRYVNTGVIVGDGRFIH